MRTLSTFPSGPLDDDPPSSAMSTDRFGFPSGHAAATTALVVGAWWLLRSAMARSRTAVWIPLTALSRVYLGRHFLGDIAGGLFVGLASVGVGWTPSALHHRPAAPSESRDVLKAYRGRPLGGACDAGNQHAEPVVCLNDLRSCRRGGAAEYRIGRVEDARVPITRVARVLIALVLVGLNHRPAPFAWTCSPPCAPSTSPWRPCSTRPCCSCQCSSSASIAFESFAEIELHLGLTRCAVDSANTMGARMARWPVV